MNKFKTPKETRISLMELMLPVNSNFGGKIHGGYILNLMDQIAFACASKHSQSYCVTASVNKVDFLNPIEVGELVTLKASINYTGCGCEGRIGEHHLRGGQTLQFLLFYNGSQRC